MFSRRASLPACPTLKVMAIAAKRRYVLGDSEFELDPEGRSLARSGESIHLTKKPFAVLVYLIENRDRMVGRQELIDNFWDGHEVYEETLTKCVGAIRKALGDSSDNPTFISTHWAEGYRFIGNVTETDTSSRYTLVERTRAVSLNIENDISETKRVRTLSFPLPVVALAIAAIAILGFGGWYFANQRSSAGETGGARVTSIAVIPFANLTGSDEASYLTDGITENLITFLSRDSNLAVAAPGSSFAARDRNLDLLSASKLLHVEAILTGSVQRDDEILRVSARLVDGGSGRVLWTREFARSSSEIFILQEEVARDAMAAISGEPRSQTTPIAYGTSDVEAYIFYLKGRRSWHKQTEAALLEAISFFERAVNRDQNFALAWCGLSDAHNALGFYFRAPNDVMPKAEEYADRALAIDPNNVDALFSSASVKYWYRRDLRRTEELVTRALEIAPTHALSHDLHGDYLISVGRVDEGLAEVRKAVELDPLAHFNSCDLGWQYYNAGRYAEAVSQSRQNLESNEFCPFDRLWIGQALAQSGDFGEGQQELQLIDKYEPEWVPGLAERGSLYALSGNKRKALEQREELSRISKSRFVDPFAFAVIEASLGNTEETLGWLERALAANSYNLVFLKQDARFGALRRDPRYADLVRRAGLEINN